MCEEKYVMQKKNCVFTKHSIFVNSLYNFEHLIIFIEL